MFFFKDEYSESGASAIKLEETTAFLNQKAKEEMPHPAALPDESRSKPGSSSGDLNPDSTANLKEDQKLDTFSKDSPKGNKLKSKREGYRKRTRKSRDRKAIYIKELEEKIKGLEMENFRLHHLLLIYRKDSWNSVSQEPGELLQEIETHRKKLEETFVDPTTGQYNERATNIKCSEYFRQTAEKVIESHNKVMNLSFEMIVDHLHPFVSFNYWKYFSEGYNASHEQIKKFNKRTKFEKPEFITENNMTMLDQLIASFSPDKKQYNFITNVMLPKERQIKGKFDKALEALIKSKDLIAEANAEMQAFRSFMIKSEIISDKQVFNSMLSFTYQVGAERKLTNVWGVEIVPKVHKFNLSTDPLYGKLAKRALKKEDRYIDYKYDEFRFGQKA